MERIRLFFLNEKLYVKYSGLIPKAEKAWYIEPGEDCIGMVDVDGALSYESKWKESICGVRPVMYCDEVKIEDVGFSFYKGVLWGEEVEWVLLDKITGLCITRHVITTWSGKAVVETYTKILEDLSSLIFNGEDVDNSVLRQIEEAATEVDEQMQVESVESAPSMRMEEVTATKTVSDEEDAVETQVPGKNNMSENDVYEQAVPENLRDIIPKETILKVYERQFEQIVEQKLLEYNRRLTEVEQQMAKREAALITRNKVLEAEAATRAKQELVMQRRIQTNAQRQGTRAIQFPWRVRQKYDAYGRPIDQHGRNNHTQLYDAHGNPIQESTFSRMGNSLKGFFFGLGVTTVVIVLVVLLVTNLAKAL